MLALLAAYALTATQPADDARMKWWREARFGMFVHWGLYAIPGGEWNGKFLSPGGGEWIQTNARIKRADYEPLAQQWNPMRFDAREWVGLCKAAGMKYLVITTKHHDGFAIWPSLQGDWNVRRTPFHRDALRELARECRRQGIRLCVYYSIMDWNQADYLPKREWDREGEAKADFERYVAFMKVQLKELLTSYGDIGVLWFDGEFEGTWTHERGVDLYRFVRSLQPNLIVNNRVDKNPNGHAEVRGTVGDFGTPEQEIPANGLPGVDWESCMTMNGTWGYRKDDHDWKSAKDLVRNLIDCASRGGNYLLNVGPKPDGTIPEESVSRLHEVGAWMKRNGGAVYGTSASPFSSAPSWGRITRKGNRLFLHVYDAVDHITLPGTFREVRVLSGRKVVPHQGGEIDLRGVPRDPIATVLEVTTK